MTDWTRLMVKLQAWFTDLGERITHHTNGRIVHVPLFGLALVLESMGRFLLGNRPSSLAGCPGDVFFP